MEYIEVRSLGDPYMFKVFSTINLFLLVNAINMDNYRPYQCVLGMKKLINEGITDIFFVLHCVLKYNKNIHNVRISSDI